MRPTLDRREAERLVNTYADSILRLSYACLGDTQGAQVLCQTILRQRLEQGACLDDPAKERLWFLRATFPGLPEAHHAGPRGQAPRGLVPLRRGGPVPPGSRSCDGWFSWDRCGPAPGN